MPPNESKFVIVAAPHTSNWDFVVGLAASFVYRFKAHFIGKHTLFKGPLGAFMRSVGGIAINRSETTGFVDTIVQEFAERDQFVLAITPEGTRKKVNRWRTGFYHIASLSEVPIALAYLDYANKEVGFGPTIMPTGDIESDMKVILGFYKTIGAKYPDQVAEYHG